MIDSDVHVYRVPLPDACHEAVVPDADDDGYTIYISDQLSDQRAEQSYLHALKHIHGNDFELHDVQTVEYNAHRERKPL